MKLQTYQKIVWILKNKSQVFNLIEISTSNNKTLLCVLLKIFYFVTAENAELFHLVI